VVYFDRPRCIPVLPLRTRLRRGHGRLGVGVQNRGVSSIIAPNEQDHLDCEEWHVHRYLPGRRADLRSLPLQDASVGNEPCGHDLHPLRGRVQDYTGVRRCDTGMEIVRGDNRDKSGINNDFLCVKGRYAFDFAQNKERLTQPLVRKNGKLTPATWEEAFELIGKRFIEARDQNGGSAIGVVGSNRTTNDERLSTFQIRPRSCSRPTTSIIHRTADYPPWRRLRGKAWTNGFHGAMC